MKRLNEEAGSHSHLNAVSPLIGSARPLNSYAALRYSGDFRSSTEFVFGLARKSWGPGNTELAADLILHTTSTSAMTASPTARHICQILRKTWSMTEGI